MRIFSNDEPGATGDCFDEVIDGLAAEHQPALMAAQEGRGRRGVMTTQLAMLGVAKFAASLMLAGGAHAEGASCTLFASGSRYDSSYTALRRGDDARVYRLSSSRAGWRISSFGWHATNIVECQDCGSSHPVARAIIIVGAGSQPPPSPDLSSGQEIPRPDFIPWFELRFARVRVRRAPQPVAIGKLKGWLTAMEASTHSVVTHDIVEVIATDGCASMIVRIEAAHTLTGDLHEAVGDLLNSIRDTMADARSGPIWPSIKSA